MTDEQQLSRDLQALQTDDEPNPAFADALFAQLQDVVVARRGPSPAWMLLAAAALIAALAVGAALGSGLVRLPFLIAEASPTPTPIASPSESTTASPTAAPTASPTASPTPAPSPTAVAGIAVDGVVEIVVTDLSLRDAPGVDAERLGGLAGGGTQAFVVAGPVLADGYEWYQLSALGIPPYSGCTTPPVEALDGCPNWMGWVAGREVGGDYWLEPTTLDCPSSPMNMADLAPGRGSVERLACNPDGTITVRGWWAGPDEPGDAACASFDRPSGWLYCTILNDVSVWVGEDAIGSMGLPVFLDPGTDVAMPAPDQWVEIVGHFDDPAAQGCDEAAAADEDAFLGEEQAVVTCRAELVADSVTPVDGPF